MKEVDLLVIGSGPAGQRAAIQAVKCGRSVALAEKRATLGGVCANTGTIPSKTLREAVMYLSGYRERALYGRSFSVNHKRITYADLMKRVNHVVQHEVEVARDRLVRNGVTVYNGIASFATPNDICVETGDEVRRIRAEKIIIATGSKPYRTERVPFNKTNILDSDAIWQPDFRMDELPKSMLIIGAGIIGTEYACMFATLGIDVRLLDRRTSLFRFVDNEINQALLYHMRKEKITFYLGKDFAKMKLDSDGKVVTTLENGRDVHTDMMLFCSGRSGAIAELNLEAAGVEFGNRNLIPVNENLQTNVPHIYAAGDIIGFPALASTSMEQGRRAACHAFGIPTTVNTDLMPYGIYTIPEISVIGKTEQELSDEGVPYEIGISHFREVSRGTILGDETGMLKLIFNQKTGKLLGVHIIGENAAELVHIGQAVMAYNGSISYFINNVFNYPTLAEAYKIAALNGLKRIGNFAAGEMDKAPVPESSESTPV